jgi:hypothetical protein
MDPPMRLFYPHPKILFSPHANCRTLWHQFTSTNSNFYIYAIARNHGRIDAYHFWHITVLH